MSKKIAFVTLALLAVVFVVLGRRFQPGFLSDLWSQLFWLCVGTLATTFVLESILNHAAQRRRHSADAFAFRSFSANLLMKLQAIANTPQQTDELFEAALSGNKEFAQAAATAASAIGKSTAVDPALYLTNYLDIANALRDFSRQYIRLYSTSRKDMLTQYHELTDLANLWKYADEFSERAREYMASLKADNPNKAQREKAYGAQALLARDALVKTASQIAKLAAKTADGRGFYD